MFLRIFLVTIITLISHLASSQEVLVLGVAQDAGHPQINCEKYCCKEAFQNKDKAHMVSSLAVSDGKQFYIIDATPDFPDQLETAKKVFSGQGFGGIILTHAHIGHYTGLMYLGKEAMNAHSVPVYVMPKMKAFLEANGPWNQLIRLKNIELITLKEDQELELSPTISLTPLLVPHRDEFSETAGYSIKINGATILFIPDINKWKRWDRNILELIKKSNYAFLDSTFYDEKELPGRDISQIPHPFVLESIGLFNSLNSEDKQKIHFIHFNHTNPLLDPESQQFKETTARGYMIAKEGLLLHLD